MNLDLTLNIPTLFMIGGAVITVVIWLVRMEGRVTAAERVAAGAEADTRDIGMKLEATHALATVHKEEFYAYQVAAAKEFVTQATVAEVKRDVMEGITRMESRLETQVNRLVHSVTSPRSRSGNSAEQ